MEMHTERAHIIVLDFTYNKYDEHWLSRCDSNTAEWFNFGKNFMQESCRPCLLIKRNETESQKWHND